MRNLINQAKPTRKFKGLPLQKPATEELGNKTLLKKYKYNGHSIFNFYTCDTSVTVDSNTFAVRIHVRHMNVEQAKGRVIEQGSRDRTSREGTREIDRSIEQSSNWQKRASK